jgi:Mn2+/Fe2+ NRAMP family transporter
MTARAADERLSVRQRTDRDRSQTIRRTAADMAFASAFFLLALLLLASGASALTAGAVSAPYAGIAFDLHDIADRTLLVGMMALFFAAMCAVTLELWRRLRRDDASPRRHGRRI